MTTDYPAKILELYPSANDLARAVGVSYPDSSNSAGARWLLRIRDSIAEDIDRIMSADYPQDEIDYDGMERYTHAQWEIFTDLALWAYDADVTYSTTALFPNPWGYSDNTASAIRVKDIPNLASNLLDEIASNIGHLIVNELQQAAEDDDDDQ